MTRKDLLKLKQDLGLKIKDLKNNCIMVMSDTATLKKGSILCLDGSRYKLITKKNINDYVKGVKNEINKNAN